MTQTPTPDAPSQTESPDANHQEVTGSLFSEDIKKLNQLRGGVESIMNEIESSYKNNNFTR